MSVRSAEAAWEGNLQKGSGSMKLGSGAFEGQFSFASRFEEGTGTNPEELIGAAHAGCFSMFLSAVLSNDGFVPERVHTTAKVHLEQVDGAPWITKIELTCDAHVPNVSEETFNEKIEAAKKGCPVSKALAGVETITVNATLTN